MANFTFSIPSEAVASAAPLFSENKERLSVLRQMMEDKQNISIKFYVDKAGHPKMLVESQKTSKFSMDLTKDLYEGQFRYIENGIVISEDADCETPIEFEGDTSALQESILRQCVLGKMPLQWLPSFFERNGLMTCVINLWKGNIRLSVKRSEKLLQFLRENGHNV